MDQQYKAETTVAGMGMHVEVEDPDEDVVLSRVSFEQMVSLFCFILH